MEAEVPAALVDVYENAPTELDDESPAGDDAALGAMLLQAHLHDPPVGKQNQAKETPNVKQEPTTKNVKDEDVDESAEQKKNSKEFTALFTKVKAQACSSYTPGRDPPKQKRPLLDVQASISGHPTVKR